MPPLHFFRPKCWFAAVLLLALSPAPLTALPFFKDGEKEKAEEKAKPKSKEEPERKKVTQIEWAPELQWNGQIFPSYLIATAAMPPDEEEEQDETLLGDTYSPIGVSITSPKARTPVKITLKGSKLFAESVWEGELAKAGVEYWACPPIAWDFEALRRVRQQVPIAISITVEAGGKLLGTKSVTATVHSINDCIFGVATEEEIGDKSEEGDFEDYGWMFAAYANESHPLIDKLLQEALDTGVVNSFTGYQSGNPDEVLRQVYAIWNMLQRRGVRYSDITTTPNESDSIMSQHVRFLDESIESTQANCVDGSVLIASLLRKIGLKTQLVLVPGHMFVRVDLENEEEDGKFIGLETTLLGDANANANAKTPAPARQGVSGAVGVPEEMKNNASAKSFRAAVAGATKVLKEKRKKFSSDDPRWQIIDLQECRELGVMPISYVKPE